MTNSRKLALLAMTLLLGTTGVGFAAPIPTSTYQALKWRNVGPFLGGRTLAVSGAADEPGTFYFGATGGGVWKTSDYGLHWRPVSDKDFATGAVGALDVAPSDSNVIYAGMGESAIRGDMATGDGVYKSTDAGKTWTHAGLRETRVISAIAIDPRDPQHVWVAALGHVFGPNPERGVFETRDGGAHWTKVLFVNDQTGAIDIALDPHNPRILYAAMWQAYRRPWMLSSGGSGSGLYKSTDGGEHWTNISDHPGLPTGILGKIGVTVSGADSNRLYAIIEAKAGGVFRSDDAGATWKRVFEKSELTQRAWYFSRIYADPKSVDTVYAPQVGGIFKSTDGGESFKPLHPPHGDVHVLWIDPKNPNVMITGNDGGAGISEDGGKSWSAEDNQPTAQFYHVALDDQFPFHMYASQQDRGTVEIPSRSNGGGITGNDLRNLAGGESGFVVPVPGEPWITYAGGYDGALSRYNQRTGQVQEVDVWPDNPMGHAAEKLPYRFQWTYPVMISQFAPHALYVGSQYVLKSTDGGMNWTRISPDLTRDLKDKEVSSGGPLTQDNTTIEYYSTVFTLAESPLRQGLLWAGSDDGLVHVSKDGGKSWQDATPDLPPFTTISLIDPSHFDPGTAFLAARRYRQDDYKPYLFVTHDYGAHWDEITDGLPTDESSFAIRQDTKDPNLLFAGTLRGIYVSFNGGEKWQPLQMNLPHVPVRDMVIQPEANALVLATHGRSFWVLDDLQPLREMSAAVARDNDFLFTPQTAWLTHGGEGHGDDDEPALANAEGKNPPNGVSVYYTLKHKPAAGEKVSLVFSTADGKTIATFSNLTKPNGEAIKQDKDFYAPKEPKQDYVVHTDEGMNRFVWQMRYPDATEVPGAIIWAGSMKGPHIAPGFYRVTLKAGNAEQTREFTVAKDPRYDVTTADLEAQLALSQKIIAELDLTDRSILKLRAVRSQIKAYLDRVKKEHTENEAVEKLAKDITTQLDGIEAALIQTKSHSDEDPLNYPIRLNNKLASLEGEVDRTYARPTAQDYTVFDDLSADANAQLQALDAVFAGKLAELNALIQHAQTAPIAVPNGDTAPTAAPSEEEEHD